MATDWVIVGLGNPGPEYAATRHNAGWLAVDRLAQLSSVKLSRHKRANALTAEAKFGLPGSQVGAVLCEPLSFMNASGGPVKAVMNFYDVDPSRLIVIHDELDLVFGGLRVKQGGGDNGHNGLKSLRSALGTGDFFRIRMGIGRPPGSMDTAAYVLKPFASAERPEVGEWVERAVDATIMLMQQGLDATQAQFNTNGG